jgi:GST-like protein
MIDFYCDVNSRANSPKIAIMLEECEADYNRIAFDVYNKETLDPGFFEISPGGTVPAIVDRDLTPPLAIFESGAILLHLAERYDRFLPPEGAARSRTLQWLFWQTSQLGPAFYSLNHLVNKMEANNEAAIGYFRILGLHCLTVLGKQLLRQNYVSGDYSVADTAIYPWALTVLEAFEPGQFPATQSWLARVGARAAVQRAMPK